MLLSTLGQTPSVAQSHSLIGTLSQSPGNATFTLRLRNISRHRLVVSTYRYLYDLRLFDQAGHEVTDEASYLEATDLKTPGVQAYKILSPQQSVSLELRPIFRHNDTTLFSSVRSADCHLRETYRSMIQNHLPASIHHAGLKMAYLKATRRILLR